jgi:hypothetical protein
MDTDYSQPPKGRPSGQSLEGQQNKNDLKQSKTGNNNIQMSYYFPKSFPSNETNDDTGLNVNSLIQKLGDDFSKVSLVREGVEDGSSSFGQGFVQQGYGQSYGQSYGQGFGQDAEQFFKQESFVPQYKQKVNYLPKSHSNQTEGFKGIHAKSNFPPKQRHVQENYYERSMNLQSQPNFYDPEEEEEAEDLRHFSGMMTGNDIDQRGKPRFNQQYKEGQNFKKNHNSQNQYYNSNLQSPGFNQQMGYSQMARFFVIKSIDEDNIHKVIRSLF